MNDLNDILSSIGMSSIRSVTSAEPTTPENTSVVVPVSVADVNLSQADEYLQNILSDNGFHEPPNEENIPEEAHNLTDDEQDLLASIISENQEPEEVQDDEETDDEYDENQGEGRDLDAEEDADWDNAFSQGLIREVDLQRAEINAAVATSNITNARIAADVAQVAQPLNYRGTNENGDILVEGPDGEDVIIANDPAASTDYLADASVDTGVHFHMADGSVVDVPIVHEAAEPTREALHNEGVLPLNSPTLLLDESTSRFSGTEWYNEIQKARIIVAGIGGIGSNLVFQLARMSPEAIFMYDDDNVEMVNMSGQLYSTEDIGKSKVDAMEDMMRKYTSMRNIFALKQRFESDSEAADIMMCGFDNMVARKTFFHSWRKHLRDVSDDEKKKCLYLDGRLSIDTLQIFCLTGDDDYNISRYVEDYLFDDSEAEQTVCSMKQTTYLACMIGSMMVNLFTNFVANQLDPIIPYDLPFFTEYDAQNMIFKTEN